jgi:pimeloyl-ACP methyl ester carboxylesterase
MAWRSSNNQNRPMGLTPSNQGVTKLFNAGLENYSIYAVDLPGHGKSEGTIKSSIDEYSNFIIDFLDAMDIEHACLVGHSMGAAIALNASLSHHWRICSIVSIGGASKMIVNDAILEGLKNTFEPTVDSIVKYSWHKKTGAIADSQLMAVYFREKAKQRIIDAGSKTVYGDFLACSRFDLSQRLQEITIPVLVIASDGDRMVPLDVSWEMAKDIKGSYFVSLKNCGHFQHIEQSGKVAGELVNFLSKI